MARGDRFNSADLADDLELDFHACRLPESCRYPPNVLRFTGANRDAKKYRTRDEKRPRSASGATARLGDRRRGEHVTKQRGSVRSLDPGWADTENNK